MSQPQQTLFLTLGQISLNMYKKLCLLMMMIWTLFIMILTLKLVIMLTLVCSVDRPTLSPLTNTEIAINLLCDKDIDDDDDYEDECYDFQDELFNFEQILRMSRDN